MKQSKRKSPKLIRASANAAAPDMTMRRNIRVRGKYSTTEISEDAPHTYLADYRMIDRGEHTVDSSGS